MHSRVAHSDCHVLAQRIRIVALHLFAGRAPLFCRRRESDCAIVGLTGRRRQQLGPVAWLRTSERRGAARVRIGVAPFVKWIPVRILNVLESPPAEVFIPGGVA